MGEILKKSNCDYILPMSGQDYPIKSMDELHEFLWDHNGFSLFRTKKRFRNQNGGALLLKELITIT